MAGEPPALLVVGDSLSAAHGLSREEGWVALLETRLNERTPYRIVNASIGGDTTRGALERLPGTLKRHRPRVVIIELGGNDGLRGIALEEMKSNLTRLVELSQASGARVLLLGMHLPPNYGPVYTERFHATYHTVAKLTGAGLVPFFLKGVAEERTLMQEDGIHPRAAAQAQMLDNVWPYLEPLLAP